MNCCSKMIEYSKYSNSSEKVYTGVYGGFGGFTSKEGYRGGGELAMTTWEQHYGGRVSGLLYSAEDHEFEDDLFAGYSVAGMLYVGDQLKSYVGIGAFLGENLGCDDRRRSDSDDAYEDSGTEVYYSGSNNYCRDRSQYLFSVFPEFGFVLHLGPVAINPFVRVYYDTKSDLQRVTASYGAMLSWQVF